MRNSLRNKVYKVYNNRVKFPEEFFAVILSTNIAAVLSGAIKEYRNLLLSFIKRRRLLLMKDGIGANFKTCPERLKQKIK